jgi:HD-GYP domain-containing protein (c-di-GMP phosphodiesterase class II)
MQLAAQQGYLSAAGRGLGNSSLASGASEAALVAGATPLAQQNAQEAQAAKAQNAQLNTQASEFNSAQNTAAQEQQASLNTQNSQFNASTQAAMAQFNAQNVTTANATTANAQNSMTQLAQQLTNQLKNTFTSGQQAQALANVQGQWSSLISSNSAAASLYGQMLSSIGTLMSNQNVDPTRAAAGVTALVTQLNSALTVMNEIQGGTQSTTIENPSTGASTTTPTKPGAVATSAPVIPHR